MFKQTMKYQFEYLIHRLFDNEQHVEEGCHTEGEAHNVSSKIVNPVKYLRGQQ